jgi:hypothetical protein
MIKDLERMEKNVPTKSTSLGAYGWPVWPIKKISCKDVKWVQWWALVLHDVHLKVLLLMIHE